VIYGTHTEGLQEYLLEKRHLGITEYRYHQIIQHLTFDPVAVITAFNDGLHNLITVGGHCAIDEQIWCFLGLSTTTQTLDRKPRYFPLLSSHSFFYIKIKK
jgi:hypothetical protein